MLQSGHQNPKWLPKWPPKWPPKWFQNYLKFNVDGLEDHIIPLCMGASRAAKPFLKLVLQSGYQNPRWPPNGGNNETDLEDLFNAIRTPLSRHTALSYSVYCAMERLLLLDIAGVAPRNDAYADVVFLGASGR